MKEIVKVLALLLFSLLLIDIPFLLHLLRSDMLRKMGYSPIKMRF
jgi:hypothetical protein